MIDRRTPVLVHSWLGPMYSNGNWELAGSIQLDSAIRLPRKNGKRDAEIIVEVEVTMPGPQLSEHLDTCANRIRKALDHLPDLKCYACQHAPAEWLRSQTAQPGPRLIDRLFLDSLEVSSQMKLTVAFDYGDLDMLVLQLDQHGKAREVLLRA